MSEISIFLNKRYGLDLENGKKTIDYIESLWPSFQPFADPEFLSEFCSGDHDVFYQRAWEMLLCNHLQNSGIAVSSEDHGPDFLVKIDDKPVWIEAIAPTAGIGENRLPAEYLTPDLKRPTAFDVPCDAILLRWTNAIDEKHRKYRHYRSKGLLSPQDSYVIAINSCLLGRHGFDGISQKPVAVEAVFPSGPLQVMIDRKTHRITGSEYQFRKNVTKKNKIDVSTGIFLDDKYSAISAILGCPMAPEYVALGEPMYNIIVHNPLARNPIPVGSLGADKEYILRETGDGFEIREI